MALLGSNGDVVVGRRPKVYLEVRTFRVSFGWGFSQMSHVNNVEIRDPNTPLEPNSMMLLF